MIPDQVWPDHEGARTRASQPRTVGDGHRHTRGDRCRGRGCREVCQPRSAERRPSRAPRRSRAAARAARAPRGREPELRDADPRAGRAHGPRPRPGDRAARARARSRATAHDPIRAAALWTRAHDVDPSYPPVWMPLADALAAADELDTRARAVRADRARRPTYDDAAPRVGGRSRRGARPRRTRSSPARSCRDGPRRRPRPPRRDARRGARDLAAARRSGRGAIEAAERVAEAQPGEAATRSSCSSSCTSRPATSPPRPRRSAASSCSPTSRRPRAGLWRRRAQAVPRRARPRRRGVPLPQGSARVRARRSGDRVPAAHGGDGARRVGARASLLYREIAAATTPRERGALHLELALIYDEQLDDDGAGAGQLRAGARVRSDDPRGQAAARAPLRGDRPPRRCREALRGGRGRRRAPPIGPALARGRRPLPRAADRARRSRISPRSSIAPRRPGDREAALDLAHISCGVPSPATPPRSACSRTFTATLGRSRGAHRAHHRAREPRRDGDERAAAWLEVARLAEDLGALDQAARAYDLALVEDPDARRRPRCARRARVQARRLRHRRCDLSRSRRRRIGARRRRARAAPLDHRREARPRHRSARARAAGRRSRRPGAAT